MEVKVKSPLTPKYKVLFPPSDILEKSPYDQTMYNLNFFLDKNFVYTTPRLNKQRPKSPFLLTKFPIEKKILPFKKIENHPTLRLINNNIYHIYNKSKRPMSATIILIKKRHNKLKNILSNRSIENNKNSSIELKPEKKFEKINSRLLRRSSIKNNLSSFDSTDNSSKKKFLLSANKSNKRLSVILNDIDSSFMINKNNYFRMNSSTMRKKTKKSSSSKNNFLNSQHRGSANLIYNIGITKKSNLEIRKSFHNQVFLNNLKKKINLYEHSNKFIANDRKIKENVIHISKFQRNIFNKNVKSAYKNNNYFYKHHTQKKEQGDYYKLNKNKGVKKIINSKSARNLLKQVNKVTKKVINGRNILLHQKTSKVGSNNIKSVMKIVVPKAKTIREMDNEEFKNQVLSYRKEVGNFFYYRGCGIFSEHLNVILRGDRLVQEIIKFDN